MKFESHCRFWWPGRIFSEVPAVQAGRSAIAQQLQATFGALIEHPMTRNGDMWYAEVKVGKNGVDPRHENGGFLEHQTKKHAPAWRDYASLGVVRSIHELATSRAIGARYSNCSLMILARRPGPPYSNYKNCITNDGEKYQIAMPDDGIVKAGGWRSCAAASICIDIDLAEPPRDVRTTEADEWAWRDSICRDVLAEIERAEGAKLLPRATFIGRSGNGLVLVYSATKPLLFKAQDQKNPQFHSDPKYIAWWRRSRGLAEAIADQLPEDMPAHVDYAPYNPCGGVRLIGSTHAKGSPFVTYQLREFQSDTRHSWRAFPESEQEPPVSSSSSHRPAKPLTARQAGVTYNPDEPGTEYPKSVLRLFEIQERTYGRSTAKVLAETRTTKAGGSRAESHAEFGLVRQLLEGGIAREDVLRTVQVSRTRAALRKVGGDVRRVERNAENGFGPGALGAAVALLPVSKQGEKESE